MRSTCNFFSEVEFSKVLSERHDHSVVIGQSHGAFQHHGHRHHFRKRDPPRRPVHFGAFCNVNISSLLFWIYIISTYSHLRWRMFKFSVVLRTRLTESVFGLILGSIIVRVPNAASGISYATSVHTWIILSTVVAVMMMDARVALRFANRSFACKRSRSPF